MGNIYGQNNLSMWLKREKFTKTSKQLWKPFCIKDR